MDKFTKEHAKRLLNKEWLAKSDISTATPYLFKYAFSPADLSCYILITDTKLAWAEVLNSKQMARRWRTCNLLSPEPSWETAKEDSWREKNLKLLSNTHTLGGIGDLSFEIVESHHSDLAFQLECEVYKWRWETCFLGYKHSSEIISEHLIFPLISLNHLTFSMDVVSEIPDSEIEKAVDKLGRIARRTVDTHIKNAISKPRVATAIRRMTEVFNFVTDLSHVISTTEKPELQVEAEERITPKVSRELVERKRDMSPKLAFENTPNTSERIPQAKVKAIQPYSETESEGDVLMEFTGAGTPPPAAGPSRPTQELGTRQTQSRTTSPPPAPNKAASPASDSESSPHRPVKKTKSKALSSDENSEEERKKRVALLKSGNTAGGVKRGGTKQPIRRGVKRF